MRIHNSGQLYLMITVFLAATGIAQDGHRTFSYGFDELKGVSKSSHSIGSAAIITDVRRAIAHQDFALADSEIQAYRSQNGLTPEVLEALSWMGRGALAARNYSQAASYAQLVQKLAIEQLQKRRLDAEGHLPIALGAAIEVQAQVLAAQGERSEAEAFLRRELKTYYDTSLRARIQKNINLVALEGNAAPAFDTAEYLGPKPPPLASLGGKVVLLFFWAHWCADCKAEASVLERVNADYGSRLMLIGPTQRYGYGANGDEATPAEELKYIDAVRLKYYGHIAGMPVPVSEDAFKTYGASTTPTLVLIDRSGVVRMYHPGRMTYEELKPKIDKVLST
ncbi:MAG: hypothetical protein ACR2NN_14055 [Bryobacteraceae bacterium]